MQAFVHERVEAARLPAKLEGETVRQALERKTAAPLGESMSPAMKFMAHGGHLALYLLMLAVSFSGWLFSSAAGYPSPGLGLFDLPYLVPRNAHLQGVAHDLHLYPSLGFGVLIAGHIEMALKHHFVDKDDTLRSMTRRAGS